MRFYLASSFAMRDRVQAVCDRLLLAGHRVPVRWWDHTSEAHEAKAAGGTDQDFYALPTVQATAARDFGGVATCDVFLLVADTKPQKFNGATVELGYALALGKPCYVLGKMERSAMFAHATFADHLSVILDAVAITPRGH